VEENPHFADLSLAVLDTAPSNVRVDVGVKIFAFHSPERAGMSRYDRPSRAYA
jgi:hypothetical protein